VAVNSAGILFIYDSNNYRIREVNLSTGVITTVAGNGTGGYSGDGGQATTAEINAGWAIALDSAGDLFIADGNNRIREVNQSTGIISTVAGNGTSGYSGDGGQATAAEIGVTWAMTLDAAGDIFISTNNRIREVKHSTGVISTVAGNGTSGFSGDGGSATAAELFQAQGLAVDPLGDLFIADTDNNRIREVNATTGVITTIAGNGTPGNIGDGGKASAAELHQPVGLLLDAFGNLFVADSSNEKIRKIT
jgi:sugar lactone lactonase YvrE